MEELWGICKQSAVADLFMPLKLGTQVEIFVVFVPLMFCLQEEFIPCHDVQEID